MIVLQGCDCLHCVMALSGLLTAKIRGPNTIPAGVSMLRTIAHICRQALPEAALACKPYIS